MEWVEEPYDDGEGRYWLLKSPIGEFAVEHSPWVDAASPWFAHFWVGIPARDPAMLIGSWATAEDAKKMAMKHLCDMAERLANACDLTEAGRKALEEGK